MICIFPFYYKDSTHVSAADDSETILQKNPQILEDVKRESERMRNERNRLLSQLDEMQADDVSAIISGGNIDEMNQTTKNYNSTQQDGDNGEENHADDVSEEQITDSTDDTNGEIMETETTSNRQPIYNMKEITIEVIAQMKADLTKVRNFLFPERLQQQIQPIIEQKVMPFLKTLHHQHLKPAINTLFFVAKDMCISVIDLVKRHATAFLNKNGGEEQSAAAAAAAATENK